MSEGADRRLWNHTALVCSTIANVVNFSGKSIPYSAFHPYQETKVRKVKPSELASRPEFARLVAKSKQQGKSNPQA